MFSLRCSYLLLVCSLVVTFLIIGLTMYMVTREERVKLVLVDSDGGADDIHALLMLARFSMVNIMAVTTVSGNTGARNASRNIRAALDLIKYKRPKVMIYPGIDEDGNKTEGYYGWDGLGDFLPPQNISESYSDPATILAQTVANNTGQVTVLCLGPLTNIANALKMYPNFLRDVKQIVIVGASYKGGGNVKKGVEFNMEADADSASYVFSRAPSDNPIVLVPLETIDSYASFPLDWREETLGSIRSRYMKFLNMAERKSLHKDTMWRCYDQTGAGVILKTGFVLDSTLGQMSVDTSSTDDRGAARFDTGGKGVAVVTRINRLMLKLLLVDSLS